MTTRNVGYEWAPDVLRCPWSQLTPEVWTVLAWWADWQTVHSVLPWGDDVREWPAYVYEAIRLCQEETQTIANELSEKDAEQWQQTKKSASR